MEVVPHPPALKIGKLRLRAESDEQTLAEVDGEALGGLPLEADVLPRALNLVVP